MLAVGQKQKNSGADTFVNQLREDTGIKMIPRKSPLEFMYEALANNHILTLGSDQDAKTRGVFVKFFSSTHIFLRCPFSSITITKSIYICSKMHMVLFATFIYYSYSK